MSGVCATWTSHGGPGLWWPRWVPCSHGRPCARSPGSCGVFSEGEWDARCLVFPDLGHIGHEFVPELSWPQGPLSRVSAKYISFLKVCRSCWPCLRGDKTQKSMLPCLQRKHQGSVISASPRPVPCSLGLFEVEFISRRGPIHLPCSAVDKFIKNPHNSVLNFYQG